MIQNREIYIANFGGNPGTVSIISITSYTPPPPSHNNNNNTMTTGGFDDHGGNSIDITGNANGGIGISGGHLGNRGHSGSATSSTAVNNVINDNGNSWLAH